MDRRSQLQRLIRDLKSLAQWQTSGLAAPALPLASDREREALEARKQAMSGMMVSEAAKVAPPKPQAHPRPKPATKAQATPPSESKVEQAATSPPKTSPPKTSPPEAKPKRESKPAPGAPWKVSGARPKPTYRAGTANPTKEKAWSDDSLSADKKLELIEALIGDCKRCGLCAGRTHIVMGEGNSGARMMVIGNPPTLQEDRQRRPFVGDSGELLDKMIVAMGLQRADIYMTNATKCHPPNDQEPTEAELVTCAPFLQQQIEAIQPEVIVTFGQIATTQLLGKSSDSVRGTWQDYNGIPVMPTYHPDHLLRNPRAKGQTWTDLKLVMERLQG